MIVVETVGDPGVLNEISNIKHIEVKGKLANIYTESGESSRTIMREIIKKTDIVRMETHKPSLYDIFMKSVKSESK
jgi:ABC-type uncharacterized transport system ATPase subunit